MKKGNQYFSRQGYGSGALVGGGGNYSSNLTHKLKAPGRQTQAASSSGNSGVSKSRPDMNITAPVLSFSGANLHSSNVNQRVDDMSGGSPRHQTRTASSGGVGGLRTSAAASNGMMGGRILATHNKTQLINSSRVGQGQGLGPLGPSSASPQSLGSNLQRIPASRQNGSNLASPKQASSATGMPASSQHQGAQYQGGKRTIMSGIVRRQPLPAGQTAAPEHYQEPAEGYIPPSSAASGGMPQTQTVPSNLASPVAQSGVINANKISFYPTGPARQSQLQPQQQ